MENVEGAPVDGITLCGQMFGLEWDDGTPLYRHRLFESTEFMLAPGHPKHTKTLVSGRLLKGRARLNNGYVIGGHQNGLRAMGAMGIDWMTGNELSQAIPPAYTEWIGAQLLASLERAA
jgi:DNA (cytosine-5)-methyltransferase 1